MDRFEAFEKCPASALAVDLHSSMDRFEDILASYVGYIIVIYIPVWIDLKVGAFISPPFARCIYIPVWIDLKFHTSKGDKVIYLNLHSSMDRFEVLLLLYRLYCLHIYIPVWIDLKKGIPDQYIAKIGFTFQYG